MSDSAKYNFPEFIAHNLSADRVLSEEDKRTIDEIYLTAENFTYPTTQTEANWLKVKSRLTFQEYKPELKVVKRPALFSFTKWAAAAVIIITVTFGIIKLSHKSNDFLPMVQNTSNTLKKIVLPDGSIVTLNTFSNLSTNDFDSDERIVTFSGEAFFEIIHNDKPFIVKTANGQVEVMGTKFNIRSRKNSPLQVALSSGNISLITAKGVYKMNPGDVLTQENNNAILKSHINTSTLGWLEEKLVFENETLSNIVNALESQYNVTIEYDSNLKSEKLTLTFNKLTAQQAVELLSKTLNSKVVVK